MLKKPYYLVALVLAGCLVQSASAQTWTGIAGNGLWGDTNNWSPPVLPTTNSTVFLAPANDSWEVTIVLGEAGYADTIDGPDWGFTLNIYGTLDYIWYLAPVQWDSLNPSTINMYGTSFLFGEGIALGHNWWWNGGPYVNMNMYDNATVNLNWFFWGGHLSLYGGTFTTGGVTDGTEGAVSDATRMMNLAGGKLILPGDATSIVEDWISRGIIEGYGVVGSVVIDTNTYPGHTIVIGGPRLVITNDSGGLKLQWPISASSYVLEATTNLAQPFTLFDCSMTTNTDLGVISVTVTNPGTQMFFRLHRPEIIILPQLEAPR